MVPALPEAESGGWGLPAAGSGTLGRCCAAGQEHAFRVLDHNLQRCLAHCSCSSLDHQAGTSGGRHTTQQLVPHLLKPWHDAVLVEAVTARQLHHDGARLALLMAHRAGVTRLARCMLPRLLPDLLLLFLLLLLLSSWLCIIAVVLARWLFGTAHRWRCACCCCSLCWCRHLANRRR